MNPPDAMPFDEAQIHLLFEEAGLTDAPAPDQQRIESVLQRAVHECIIKDTGSFLFKGFPAVISAVLDVASGTVSTRGIDYRA